MITPHLQVNHLSPVLLTLELLPKVLEVAETTGDGRVVFVSSEAHRLIKWDPLNFSPESEEGYARFKMYGWTKLYNVSLLKLCVFVCVCVCVCVCVMYATIIWQLAVCYNIIPRLKSVFET